MVEILYEPEAGWFKLISDSASRDDVTQFVEDVIYSIGEEEATIAKGNTPVNAEQRRQLPDVDISGDKPRILRWAKHEACPTNPEAFEPYAFPEGITTAPYRHIWRGVEECPDLDDINQLLLKASHTWMASELPKTMDDAERVLGCQVVWNLRGTVLYMSSFDSAETVLNAAKKLDLAISILVSIHSYSTACESTLTEIGASLRRGRPSFSIPSPPPVIQRSGSSGFLTLVWTVV